MEKNLNRIVWNDTEEFPQIKFSSKKKGKEYNCLHDNKEIIKDA